MSGFEIAGIVLGALPILIEVVKSYKGGLQTGRIFFRKQAILGKLSAALLLQQETLAQIVKTILIQSGHDNALDLETNPYECLNNGHTQDQVLEYLGSDSLIVLNENLRQSYAIVQRVASNILALVPATEQGQSDDLRRLIMADDEQGQGWRDLKSRAKLVFSAGELSRAIKELDDTATSLTRLVSLIAFNRQPVEQNSSRKALKLGKGLRQVRRFAVDLHQAVFRAWKADCHEDHQAKLFLDDRIKSAESISRVPRSQVASSSIDFRLIFAAASASASKEASWHRATIKVSTELLDNKVDQLDEPLTSRTSRVTLSLPEKPSTTMTAMPLVDDICDTLASSRRHQQQIALMLSRDQRMATVISKEAHLMPCERAEKVTLRTLLHHIDSSNQSANFPLKPRMMLALRLASSLLQLASTPWLRRPWSKDEIFFHRRPSTVGCYYDLDQPFISLTFDGRCVPHVQAQEMDAKAMLLELGILLLELWHTHTLEAHFPEQQGTAEYYQRLALAMRWLDDPSNPLPELYDKAVSHCIRGMIGGEVRLHEWEDAKFWGAVCQDIIEPLHEICKQWRAITY